MKFLCYSVYTAKKTGEKVSPVQWVDIRQSGGWCCGESRFFCFKIENKNQLCYKNQKRQKW